MDNDNLNETTFAENTATAKSTFNIKSLIPIVIAIVVIFGIFKSCGGGKTEEMYVGCAKDIMAKNLKNPDSMVVNEGYVVEEDEYGTAIVYLDYTAENSFGGSVRNKVYVCVKYLDDDGHYQYSPHFSYIEVRDNYKEETLESFKELCDFGEPEE